MGFTAQGAAAVQAWAEYMLTIKVLAWIVVLKTFQACPKIITSAKASDRTGSATQKVRVRTQREQQQHHAGHNSRCQTRQTTTQLVSVSFCIFDVRGCKLGAVVIPVTWQRDLAVHCLQIHHAVHDS
jgi:hypothetical protein